MPHSKKTKADLIAENETLRSRVKELEQSASLPSGEVPPIQSNTIPSGGKFVSGVGVVEDVTERGALETQLRESQKMETLGALAAGVAHEMNNILQPIVSYTSLLQQRFKPDTKEDEYLEAVSQAVTRAKTLINQILFFRRTSQPAKFACLLGPVAKEVFGLVRSTTRKTIEMEILVSKNLAPVFCDSSQIHQMLLNLCVNSGQAMPNLGNLTINLENIELEGFECFAGTTLYGKHVRIAVSDAGVGMDEETIAQIFDPFFTTRRSGEGTGLGLSTVYGIVRDHGGGIVVLSEPGKGTTIEVYLPAVEREIAGRFPQKSQVSSGGETILFLDDEEMIVEASKLVLEQFGYKVAPFTDSQKALKIFRANPYGFDLVLTDQTMPDSKGEEFAKELRKIRGDVPIILCTGNRQTMISEKKKAIGINAFLEKPIEPARLGQVVRKILAQRR